MRHLITLVLVLVIAGSIKGFAADNTSLSGTTNRFSHHPTTHQKSFALDGWRKAQYFVDQVKIMAPVVLTRLCGLYFPTGFSPNGDGHNDVFKAYVTDSYLPSVTSLRVYNRAGSVIFETNDIEAGWDGFSNGEALPTGVYVWVCEGVCTEGPFVEYGNVTLIR